MSDAVTLEREPDLLAAIEPRLRSPDRPARPPQFRIEPKRGGLPKSTILLAAAAIGSLLWGVWMTKEVADLKHRQVPIAAVRLQPLIEEYVQAQARSGTPEEQVMRQTQAFMTVLDTELLRRGKDGTTVLVAEAVLSKNVPDITGEVRQAVYAKVPPPAAGRPRAQPQMMPQMMPNGGGTMGQSGMGAPGMGLGAMGQGATGPGGTAAPFGGGNGQR